MPWLEAKKLVVKLTANFERNLEDIERFLIEAAVPRAYDVLLDELLDTVIRNLERFPRMGRPFLAIRHQRQLSFDFESHWGANSPTS